MIDISMSCDARDILDDELRVSHEHLNGIALGVQSEAIVLARRILAARDILQLNTNTRCYDSTEGAT